MRSGPGAEREAQPVAIFGARIDPFVPFWAVIGDQVHSILVLGQYLGDTRTRVAGICFEDDTRANPFKQSGRSAQNGI